MTKLMILCVCCLTTTTAFAAMNKTDRDRLRASATVVSEFRDAPDGGIPGDLWDKAQCVLVIPSVKKAAFVLGGEYGAGAMSCRDARGWSAPVFMTLAKGSVGFQIGAQETDLILLVMNRGGLEKLLRDKVTLGADASVAAGPVGRSAAAGTDARLVAEMLSYSRSHGVFAGIDLSGGVLRLDDKANARTYGPVNAADIVKGTRSTAVPPAAQSFVSTLSREMRATSGRR
jgi:lipid-binding SYLF domain-containing protein